MVKGRKGKIVAPVAAVVITGSVIAAALGGANLIYKLNNENRPNSDKNDIVNSELDTDRFNGDYVQEPDINMENGYGDYTPESILPELQQPIIPEEDNIESTISPEFVDTLAKLTTMAKDYFNSSNLTVVGVTSMTANSANGDVKLLGYAKVGNNYNHIVFNMNNVDVGLDVYSLTEDITEDELILALDQLLNDKGTEYKCQLKHYISLSNESSIIVNMLNNRLAGLDATADSEEIEYINNMLKDTSKLKLNVLLNNRQDLENGYNYSFSIILNTGKYTYSSDFAFESDYVLMSSALKHSIENHLDSNTDFEVNATESTAINQAMYIINNNAYQEQQLAK